ncbi:hypothetical protein [Piscinibacter gummiphilus]|uniref:RiboL-PSP-HEPN domain-containing protein n=1 Tax=Piscinibacter gummiphilus TaxID=946333 RepID=A0ABZ0CPG9_9BURK|nr:hypothetical protein [Piscinibacter gummiphilus]WOB06880.1 hypothetical protein RXV79_18380 [Piscinibacter gummiphilus]
MDTAPAEPYVAFLKESSTFHNAIVYLLAAHLSAIRKTDAEVAEVHDRLSSSVAPVYNDPRSYFVARLFIAHIAAFEVFLQDTISAVIQKHPKKVGDVEFRLADILDSPTTTELVQRATDAHLNKLMYKKPNEYLKEVCALLSIEREPLDDDWKILVEAKARRDLGVHNSWKCNGIYLRKLHEAGIASSLAIGDSAVPQEKAYLYHVTDALERLSKMITLSVLEKHWPALAPVVKSDA